jgi:hypothetical protein
MSDLLSIFNKLSADTLFDYYQALYWYASENHEGQFTELYSILSTLPYKPALHEQATDIDLDTLGFPVSHASMLLLATALRLYTVVQDEIAADEEDRLFVKLHWVAGLDLYLAEYHDFNEEHTEHDTFYMVYSVSTSGTICNETFPPD